jgi:hypothetical protein
VARWPRALAPLIKNITLSNQAASVNARSAAAMAALPFDRGSAPDQSFCSITSVGRGGLGVGVRGPAVVAV